MALRVGCQKEGPFSGSTSSHFVGEIGLMKTNQGDGLVGMYSLRHEKP
jgi:hypothetical protein